MSLKDVKCEIKQFIFQRIVQVHSVDGPLPTDKEAQLTLSRADETLAEVKGGSHLHQVDVPDPIIDALTFDDAVVAADVKISELNLEVSSIDAKQLAGIKSLVEVGTPLETISKLSGFSIDAIKKALST